jgi:hypothetical protein
MAAQPVLFSMRVFGLEARFRGAQNTERLIITQGVTSHQETKMRKRGRKRRRETEREGGREGERWLAQYTTETAAEVESVHTPSSLALT